MTPSTRERDRWVQACLQKLIAPSLTVDGALGPRSLQALKEFQRRVHEFAPDAPTLTIDGRIGPTTLAALAAATGTPVPGEAPAPPQAPTLRTMAVAREPAPATDPVLATADPADAYAERRVSVRLYGTLPTTSPLLVPVPGTGCGPKRLHVLAAKALARMSAAAEQALGLPLLLASAWRAHRWESRAQYEAVVIAKYGSLAEGRRWLAFDSPHETGLAIDIGVGGLTPSRASVDAQRKTPLHQWLVAHAWEFGWHPYKVEPWHWEHAISLAAHRSGVLAADDPGPPIDAVSFGLDDDEEEAVLEDMDLGELPA